MIKKLLILTLSLAALCGVSMAQQIDGRWTIYPVVGDGFSRVIETPTRVYTLSGNTLSHYNFSDNELYTYNSGNLLSENGKISNIFYNYNRKYLLVAYTSGNIDLIYDDGGTVNLPEIRDAVLTTDHTINDVTFDGKKIYVATAFGFVIFDDERHEVSESGILGFSANHVFHINGHLLVHKYPDMYVAADGTRRSSISHFKKTNSLWTNAEAIQIAGNAVAYKDGDNGLTGRIYPPNPFDQHTAKTYHAAKSTNDPITGEVVRCANGVFTSTAAKYICVDSLHNVTSIAVPEALKGGKAVAANGLSSVWVEKDGELARYDLSGSSPKKLMTINTPEGTRIGEPVFLKWNKDFTRLYIANPTANFIYTQPFDNMETISYLDIIENGQFTDAGIKDASRYTSYPDFFYDTYSGRITGNVNFVIDPDDDDIVYYANNNCGLVMAKGNDILGICNRYNNPTPSGSWWWRNRTMNVDIDHDGNLWMFIGYQNGDPNAVIGILPASKRKQLDKVKLEDWYTISHEKIFTDDNSFQRDVRSLFCTGSSIKFFTAGAQEGGFVAYDDNGTPFRSTDDKSAYYYTVTDTEGNDIFMIFNYDIVEDKNGAVWFATDRGVFYITNPADALNPATLRVKRPIVPRNDGTNFGDYLLETERVYCIGVDPSNRKWLGTISAGVYLVSADGTKIIAHYTAENSPLPSNSVYSITCDPTSNRVYFGTANGLVAFDSDSAPAAESYSDVYAYPNPVRPEYTGWITITGLMDNSLVKIADTAGNVFFTGRSEGGVISWDGCDPSGKRVKTGVYLVFASQNASGSSSGAVTKIMVVN
ncbi:MAG: hypothetical protein NC418_08460 [Muribaculaceae bacterium]|nr:hypothetical protein [Muribaculaceae bacterium]